MTASDPFVTIMAAVGTNQVHVHLAVRAQSPNSSSGLLYGDSIGRALERLLQMRYHEAVAVGMTIYGIVGVRAGQMSTIGRSRRRCSIRWALVSRRWSCPAMC